MGGLTWDSFGTAMAFALVIAGYYFCRKAGRAAPPSAGFSAVAALQHVSSESTSWRQRWNGLPGISEKIAFILFAVALADPRLPYEYDRPFINKKSLNIAPIEGAAIYFLLDYSGSMGQKVLSRNPLSESIYQPKIDLLKLMTHALIAGDPDRDVSARPSDMLGVIAFARSAQVLVPLTLDHEAVLSAIDDLQVLKDQDSAGTALGYAIFKGASLIEATRYYTQQMLANGKEPYTIRDAVMILITDGFQDPNRLDRGKELRNIPPLQAAEYAKGLGIRLYIINIDPTLASDQYAAERHQMERTAELTGGKFFLLSERNTIRNLYAQVDELEKSLWYNAAVESKQPVAKALQRHWPLYPYLLGSAMFFFAAAITLETLVLRRWP